MRRIIALWLTLLCALVATATGVRAATVDQFRRRAAQIATQAMSSDAASGSVAGIAIVRGGTALYSHNNTGVFAPASLLKLLTTTTAAERFGPTARFTTRVLGSTPDTNGAVTGDVYVVGGGDPTFATKTFASRYFVASDGQSTKPIFPNGTPTVEDLAGKVAGAGVKTIAGNLVADESLFDSDRWQPGWKASYQQPGDVDVGNLSAMTVNMGFDSDHEDRVSSSPATTAANFLRSALSAAGVTISGTVKLGRAPAGSTELASVQSPSLREIVGWTNRWSVNYPAEILIKDLAARFGGAGHTPNGVAVVKALLKSKRIPIDGLAMSDGSGLSTKDRAEPATIMAALRLALAERSDAAAAIRDSLPVAGRPGTLLKRMQQSPTGGNLRGKTGLLSGVRGMAGWVRCSDGSTIVYVVVFNRARDPGALTSTLDRFGRGLALLPN